VQGVQQQTALVIRYVIAGIEKRRLKRKQKPVSNDNLVEGSRQTG